jgi:hypothetical protein
MTADERPDHDHDTDADADAGTDSREAAAYAAWKELRFDDAGRGFDALLAERPDAAYLHYMRGLVHKYRREWDGCLRHNLRALGLQPAGEPPDQAMVWNAAIAATGLRDWAQARALWKRIGLRIDDGDGPIEQDFGVAVTRLNPWGDGETVWFRRLSPCHGRLLNVPMPESGFRFGDLVLHDGAPTGSRRSAEGQDVPVFNALERLEPSPFSTFTVLLDAATAADLDALETLRRPGLGYLEDWTGSFRVLCRRCSYGTPHAHAHDRDAEDDDAWQRERDVGFAAQSRAVVDAMLAIWLAGAVAGEDGEPTRRVDTVRLEEHPLVDPDPDTGFAWWRSPDDDDDDDAGGDGEDESGECGDARPA